jgi:hypothetical protein
VLQNIYRPDKHRIHDAKKPDVMTIWMKHRDGQWVCYRAISNDDEQDK